MAVRALGAGMSRWSRTGQIAAVLSALAVIVALAQPLHHAAALNPGTEAALHFDGTNDYVTFGDPAALHLPTFTIETWFRRDGTGVGTTTGSGGIASAIPLVTKGAAQGETPANINMNWFLGIDATSGVLVADFEDTAGGGNHPVSGTTAVTTGLWTHAAATYDGTTWRLYLNGVLDRTLVVGAYTPESTSIQRAGLATSLTSTGTAAGFFNGAIDETRVWSGARSQAQIQGSMNSELTSGTNLVARWGLNEGTGATVASSVGSIPGTLTNGPTWVNGFNYVEPTPNPGPYSVVFNGTDTAIQVPHASTLDSATFTVEAWVKRASGGATTSTGTGGLTAYPVLAKGIAEGETAAADINYFLGLDASGKVAADFEEAQTGAQPSQNHPVTGTTALPIGEWHHIAASYDGTTWHLYVDGQPDGSLTVGQPANAANVSPLGIGRAYTTAAAPQGAFAGSIDEARVWNLARTPTQIAASFDQEIATATTGLVARWGMNQDSGTAIPDSIGTHNGTLTNGTRGPGFVPPPPTPNPGPYSVVFNGTDTAIQVPHASTLDSATFTVEAWVKRASGGATTSTGTGGLTAYPVLAKGIAEAETAAADINYFLGLDASGKVAADFEEAQTGAQPSQNHPVTGTTALPIGEWHHIAASYDGTTWHLYVDGQPDGSLTVGQPANAANVSPLGIGRAYTTAAAPQGAFAGSIDEARVWNLARTPTQIAASFDQEIATATTGLVARWGMNQDSGTAIPDSIGTHNGTLTNGTRGPGFVPTTPTPPPTQPALKFNGSDQYVTFGDPASLDLPTFTIETWMRRDGAGTTTTTGTNGVPDAIPLVTHGAQQEDTPADINMNWFLGIDAAGHPVADFEDTVNGSNHPVIGSTVVPTGQWHHVAASFDGTAWRLYVDGTLDTILSTGGFQPQAATTQPAALATSMQTASGYQAAQRVLRRCDRRGTRVEPATVRGRTSGRHDQGAVHRQRPGRALGSERGHRHGGKRLGGNR